MTFFIAKVDQQLADKKNIVTLEPCVLEVATVKPISQVIQFTEGMGGADRGCQRQSKLATYRQRSASEVKHQVLAIV
jgi:hypothetical protein